jgi:hypothetical protein
MRTAARTLPSRRSEHTISLRGASLTAYRAGLAIALCEATLANRERVLGGDHPNTLTSRKNLEAARRQTEGRRPAPKGQGRGWRPEVRLVSSPGCSSVRDEGSRRRAARTT